MYVGLIDTRTLASIIDIAIAEDCSYTPSKKEVQWKTQAGVFVNRGQWKMHRLRLSQFSTKRNFSSKLHVFEKKKTDKYSFIIARDL